MSNSYTEKHRNDEHEFKCPICGIPLTARIRRGWSVRYLLFSKPFKRYICGNCRNKFYIMREKL